MAIVTQRLNRFIASQLNVGRRAADNLIIDGKVKINGRLGELGNRVSPNDIIHVDGKRLSGDQKFRYVLMDKPVGYVCSRRQQGETPTIYNLLPKQLQHLKTVGRLDKDSSGVILLTNDGDLAHKLTHPSFKKIKIYEVNLNRPLPRGDQQKISQGIGLPDGPSRLNLQPLSDVENSFRVTMHEGRNRQIRRTFAALGYEVVKLRRIQFGEYKISQLNNKKLIEIES